MTVPRPLWILLPMLLVWVGCAAAPTPETAPVAADPVGVPVDVGASLREVRELFLPRIAENESLIDRRGTDRAAVVAEQKRELADLTALHVAKGEKLSAASSTIAALRERLAAATRRRAELAEAEATLPQTLDELDREIIALHADLDRELVALTALEGDVRVLRQRRERLEALDDEGLFREAMRGLYRDTLTLYRDYYREVFALGDRASLKESVLLGDLESRIAGLEGDLAAEALSDDRFGGHRVRFERDEISHRMWLDVYILDVRFPLGEASLDALEQAERRKLEELTAILAETFAAEARLAVHVDGHADSRRFLGRSACVSATLNKELSRHRAEAVRDHLVAEIDGLAERVEVDWYGNFSLLAEADDEELRNRRIELRVTLSGGERDGGRVVVERSTHVQYFAARDGLEIAGRRFVHRGGRWIEKVCEGRPVEQEFEDRSPEAAQRLEALGLGEVVRRPIDGRELEIRLGNDVVFLDDTVSLDGDGDAPGGRCVRVAPCPAPDAGGL